MSETKGCFGWIAARLAGLYYGSHCFWWLVIIGKTKYERPIQGRIPNPFTRPVFPPQP